MRYVVLLADYVDPNRSWEDLSEEEQTAEMGRHGAFAEAVAAREGCELVGGEALTGGESATVLRPGPGRSRSRTARTASRPSRSAGSTSSRRPISTCWSSC